MVEKQSHTAPGDPTSGGAPGGRKRSFRAVLAVVLLAAGLCAVVALWVRQAAGPAPCRDIERVDLSIEEMIAVKRRVEQYERDPSAPLALSGDEASFLLAENLDYPVHLAVEGEEVAAELALPDSLTWNGKRAGGDGARCFNIDFRGRIAVDAGVARLEPTRLVVGDLDLSGWFDGRSLELDGERLAGEHARQLLDQTRELRVVDGHLEVRLDDVGSLR